MIAEFDDSILIYDARIAYIDNAGGLATFSAAGSTYPRRLSFPVFWGLGTVGLLRLHRGADTFTFYSYPDQRLRRIPECDQPDQQQWGGRSASIDSPSSGESFPAYRAPSFGMTVRRWSFASRRSLLNFAPATALNR